MWLREGHPHGPLGGSASRRTIRLTVVAPDMNETAVRPSGGPEFVVVEVKDITDVDAE